MLASRCAPRPGVLNPAYAPVPGDDADCTALEQSRQRSEPTGRLGVGERQPLGPQDVFHPSQALRRLEVNSRRKRGADQDLLDRRRTPCGVSSL